MKSIWRKLFSKKVKLEVINLFENEDLIPAKAHYYDACSDLRARIYDTDGELLIKSLKGFNIVNGTLVIKPKGCVEIPLGIAFNIPTGYKINIYLRSGKGFAGLMLRNGTAIIDCNYRKEVVAMLYNCTNHKIEIEHGDRICQYELEKVTEFDQVLVTNFKESGSRGGLGHSGNK